MPLPFLASLTAAARTIYPFIQRGVREGLSIESIGRIFRAEGFHLANATLREMVRHERSLIAASEHLRFTNLDKLIDVSRLPNALTTLRRAYSFTVEVRGIFASDKQRGTQHVTVTTDRTLTRREIESAAMEAMEAGADRYGMDVEAVQLVGGMRAGEAGTF